MFQLIKEVDSQETLQAVLEKFSEYLILHEDVIASKLRKFVEDFRSTLINGKQKFKDWEIDDASQLKDFAEDQLLKSADIT